MRKSFLPLGLWHIWQATWCTAVSEGQLKASTLIAHFFPLPLLPSTSLMFYVPVSYFSHLQWTLISRTGPSCLLSISSHYLKINELLKNWHEAIKASAFSFAVSETFCFFGRNWFCIVIIYILTLPPMQKEQKEILFCHSWPELTRKCLCLLFLSPYLEHINF